MLLQALLLLKRHWIICPLLLAASFSAAVSVTTRKTIATERFPSLTQFG